MTEKVYFTVKETDVKDFKTYLYERENAETTISKYSTDLRCFLKFLGNSREVDKARLLAYKEWLIERYAVSSVNSMLAALNQFLEFCGYAQLKVNRSSFQVTPSPEPKPFRETPPLSPEEGRQPEVAQQPERQVEQQLEPELEQLVQKPEQEQQPTMAQARTLPEIQQIKARQKPSTTTKHHSATSHRRTIRITIPKKSKPMKHQKEAAGQKKTMTLLPTSSPEEPLY